MTIKKTLPLTSQEYNENCSAFLDNSSGPQVSFKSAPLNGFTAQLPFFLLFRFTVLLSDLTKMICHCTLHLYFLSSPPPPHFPLSSLRVFKKSWLIDCFCILPQNLCYVFFFARFLCTCNFIREFHLFTNSPF